MRYAIDVLFVDNNNKVVKALHSIAPFRLSAIYFKATSAIELPAGTILDTETKKGDILVLQSSF